MTRNNPPQTLSDHLPDVIKAKEAAEINLRSEAVQDILGKPPRWMIRWGISLIFIVIFGLFVGSYFFKYPDIIPARVTIHSEHLPADVVCPISGRIDSLFVGEQQRVLVGEPLALIQSPTSYCDYLQMLSEWEAYKNLHLSSDTAVYFPFSSHLQLGELQNAYGSLLKTQKDFSQFLALNYHPEKIRLLRQQIAKQKRMGEQYRRQLTSVEQQIHIANSTFRTDSLLFAKGVISTSEYDKARQNLLDALQSLEGARNASESQQINLLQSEQQIFDLERERQLQHSEYALQYANALEHFFAQAHAWQQKHLLQSPTDGKVTLTKFSQQHQNIQAGEVLLTVIPDSCQKLVGKLYLPQRGAGKVKVGQTVHLKLDHFPHLEYGMVSVCILKLSLVPIQDKDQSVYVLDVGFPQGLTTNYGKTLPFSQNMEGQAEVITEDLRLLDKFLNPIKSILKR